MANLLDGLLNGLLGGAILTAVVWLALKLPGVALNAATRYAIWWMVTIAVAILPFRGLFAAGEVPREMPAAIASASGSLPAEAPAPAIAPTPATLSPLPAADVRPIDRHPPIRLPRLPIAIIVLAAWVTLSAALLTRLVVSFRSLRQLKATARPCPPDLERRMTALSQRAGLRRDVRLMISDDTAGPIVLGLLDPLILVPPALPSGLCDDDFDHVLLHELAHLRRGDDWTNLLFHVLAALLPIQPALVLIGRQMSLELEAACDDWVLSATGAPKPYAAALTRVAELTLWARPGVLASGEAGHPSQLYRRVQRLLDRRHRVTPRVSIIGWIAGACVVTALAAACARTPHAIELADAAPTTAEDPTTPLTAAAATTAPASNAQGLLAPVAGKQTRIFDVRPGELLRMDIDRGNVRVKTWDRNSAQITVTQKGPNAAEFAKHHKIAVTHENGEVLIYSRAEAPLRSFKGHVDVEYEIIVPAQFNADLTNSLGDFSVAGLSGKVTGVTALGNHEFSKIDGPLNSRTSTGNVTSSACNGETRLETASGNIDVRRFNGPKVDARSAAGNVVVELAVAPKGDCDLRTAMGNVIVTIPPTAPVNVYAATGMGKVGSDYPIASNTAHVFGGTIEGALNGGGPKIQLQTGMGNVQIAKP